MKKSFLLNIVVLLLVSCSSQNERMEKELMECYYQTYSDNGVELKKMISDYQSLLVREKIMADSTAKSYLNLYTQIANKQKAKHIPSKSFLRELQNIEQPIGIINRDCQTRILADSTSVKTNKIFILEDMISSVQESANLNPSFLAKQILTVLDEDDFELEYYRLRTLFLFEILNEDYRTDTTLNIKNDKPIRYDLKNALKVAINEKNDLFVNGKKVGVEQLKQNVIDFELKNKENSIIAISASRETMYKTYVDLQDTIISVIQSLRNEKSINEYQIEFNKLNDKQKKKIKEMYPIKIMETAPE